MAQLKCKAPIHDHCLKKRRGDKAHHRAHIAVVRKLVHAIYAVLPKQKPYDPACSSTSGSSTLRTFRYEAVKGKIP